MQSHSLNWTIHEGYLNLLQKLSEISDPHEKQRLNLMAFANSIPHMVWVADSAGKVLVHNDRFQDYTGYSNEEMLRHGMSQYLHPEDRVRTDEAWDNAILRGETYKIQYRLKRRDGQYRWNLGMALPFHNYEGKVEYWFGTCTDIHDQKITEEKLRQSEERYSIAIRSAEIGAWESDVDLREIEATETFYDLFGLTRQNQTLPSALVFSAIHPDDREKVRGALQNSIATLEPYTVEFRVIHLGGLVRWLVGQGRPISNEVGRPIRFVGVTFDITKRVESAQILKNSEAQFRQLAEAIPHIVWQADPQGHFTYVSKQWSERTGQPSELALGNGWLHFVHPEDQPAATQKWQESILRADHLENEFRLLMKNGEYRWFLSRWEPVKERGDQVVRWLGTSTDIHTQREIREEQRILNEATQILSSSFDYKNSLRSLMRFVVKEFGEFGCITLMDSEKAARFSEVFALSLKKEIALQDLIPVNFKSGCSVVASALTAKDVVIRRELTDRYYQNLAKDEEQLSLLRKLGAQSIMAAPLMTRGKLIGIWVVGSSYARHRFGSFEEKVFRALSERVSIALDNALLFEEARKANDLKSAFLANISHEIRSPLASILGFSELLRDEDLLPQERNSYLEVIHRNGQQLEAVINDILDLSKVEAGHLEIEYLPVDIRELLRDVIELARVKAQAKEVELSAQVDEDVPFLFSLDPVRMKQILTNLVSNAVKFTSQGSVKVFVTASFNSLHQMELLVRIVDTGIGISANKVTALFRPFSQADVSTTRKYGGTGLGLALSRKLAQAMRGEVWLEQSEPERGSEFRVVFRNVDVLQPSNLSSFSLDSGSLNAVSHNLQGLNILVVDDSSDNQNLIKHLLARRGAGFEIANHGGEAFEKALHGNFDLILCDLQMPVMDGYTMARTLRSSGMRKPMIALTAHAMTEIRQKCLDAGFTDYLPKPIHSQDLYEMILRSVAVSNQAAGQAASL
jgi:PAS domain S-box-containing protein